MGLLIENIARLRLDENVELQSVIDAIDNHDRIAVSYDTNGDGVSIGERIIDPYGVGLTKGGNPVLRAFQRGGDSKSGNANGWKFMRLDRMLSWNPTGEQFEMVTPEEQSMYGRFNPDGDRQMGTVYKIAKFSDDNTRGYVEAPATPAGLENEPGAEEAQALSQEKTDDAFNNQKPEERNAIEAQTNDQGY